MEIAMPATAEVMDDVPDERLKLMFAAAHPALDPAIRAPLILQTIFGLEASEIATLFMVPVATMAQRLVRAKTKIRDARIPFAIPGREVWPERLEAVLEAIYGAYAAGFDDLADVTADRGVEALYLADMLATLLPREAEALGLAALICFSASRAEARLSSARNFVPLDEQDPKNWDSRLIARAASHLSEAAKSRRVGRFQLEAAIQAVHADRRRSGTTNWVAIAQLYEGLVAHSPTNGVLVARAYAVFKAYGEVGGFAALAALDANVASSWPPALMCRGMMHAQAGRNAAARTDFAAVMDSDLSPPFRAWVEANCARLAAD
jgi:RNA polymerase sigma-70 factor (ECF subfamily)